MKVAGIVLYNPSINRLKENLDAIACQVDKIILVDNASENIGDVNKLLKGYNNVSIIINEKNRGVAAALNQIVSCAEQIGAEWVLTLDQDSVCQKGIIETFSKYIGLEDVASMTCIIQDRNFNLYNEFEDEAEYKYVDTCITSGNYIKISVWKQLQGFDEKLFIDKVDTDYCYRLLQNGYKIIRLKFNGLLHEIGSNTKRHSFLGKEFVVFNHSPFRCYYLIRNQIYFARKHEVTLGQKATARFKRTAWTRIFVYLLFEKNKFKKLVSWFRGLIDGYRM